MANTLSEIENEIRSLQRAASGARLMAQRAYQLGASSLIGPAFDNALKYEEQVKALQAQAQRIRDAAGSLPIMGA